ncbi:ankyrin repeat domain-containing protein 45-like [Acanthaster planci]|uniref:Ankyrin repeat domain-containing protein 45-like n=1 Tax=Acanthaster planci TaxID=133434 RepID=A0A8B7Z782_ACAPL|nr:ankyrin repeat domain-containing protein 45-like [Acanthaster planci]
MTVDPLQEEPEASPPSRKSGKRLNIVLQCAVKGDAARLLECFSKEDDPYHDRVEGQLNSRDDQGRSAVEIACTEGHLEMLKLLLEKGSDPNMRNPNTGKTALDMACILDREDMVKELLEKGAEGDAATNRGYTALHHAAAWGKLSCIKLLIQFGSNLQVRTSHGERPRETALRYQHEKCASYLDWSEARRSLLAVIREIKENVEDVQKIQGRLTKDERMTALNACIEKQEWLDNGGENLNVEDFNKQKQTLSDILEPILIKMSEPPPEKPHRR